MPYEKGYPFCPSDLEYYDACLGFVYNYKNWLLRGKELSSKTISSTSYYTTTNKKEYFIINQEVFFKKMKGSRKLCRVKNTHSIENLSFFNDGKAVVYTKKNGGKTVLFTARVKGRKLIEEHPLPAAINSGNWQGFPYIMNDGKTLYFSSDRNGSKDLFVAKIDLFSNTCDTILPIPQVNTAKDEIAPFWDEKNAVFYCSSDGRVGFGGFDLFQTTEFELIDQLKIPINPINMCAPYNSNANEIKVQTLTDGKLSLVRELNLVLDISTYLSVPLKEGFFDIIIPN